MGNDFNTLNVRSKAFAQRLRTEHSTAPEPRDVLNAEESLGTGAIGFQLTGQGKRLLFRALDLERKAKLRARKG